MKALLLESNRVKGRWLKRGARAVCLTQHHRETRVCASNICKRNSARNVSCARHSLRRSRKLSARLSSGGAHHCWHYAVIMTLMRRWRNGVSRRRRLRVALRPGRAAGRFKRALKSAACASGRCARWSRRGRNEKKMIIRRARNGHHEIGGRREIVSAILASSFSNVSAEGALRRHAGGAQKPCIDK